MKKFFVLSLIVLSMVFLVSCGGDSKKEDKESGKNGSEQTDDSDSGGTDSGSPEDYKVDENIFEVPAGQNNTPGAPCDDKTFVEFCDGNAYVDCSEEYVEGAEGEGEYKFVVRKVECNGENPVCFVSRQKDEEENREYNWAACYSSCENEDIGKGQGCTTYDKGYSFILEDYECIETSKGKLKFSDDSTPCNSACSEDGKTCEIKECDPEKDTTYCDENGVLHECAEWSALESAYFCNSMKMMVCRYEEDFGFFGCFDDPYAVDEELVEVPKDQDNNENAPCDPETFVQFCDGDTAISCGYEGEKNIVSRFKCEGATPVCLAHAYGEGEGRWNAVGCNASCEKENVGEGEICLSYNSGYTFELEKYRCIETSKGKLRFTDGTKTCNSACSEDGRTCEIKECDPAKDKAYCDENGVLHECSEWSGLETAYFCEKFPDTDMVCQYIEYDQSFGCMSKPAE